MRALRSLATDNAALMRAFAAYKDLLALWKDADPDISVLKQAKAVYAKLQYVISPYGCRRLCRPSQSVAYRQRAKKRVHSRMTQRAVSRNMLKVTWNAGRGWLMMCPV